MFFFFPSFLPHFTWQLLSSKRNYRFFFSLFLSLCSSECSAAYLSRYGRARSPQMAPVGAPAPAVHPSVRPWGVGHLLLGLLSLSRFLLFLKLLFSPIQEVKRTALAMPPRYVEPRFLPGPKSPDITLIFGFSPPWVSTLKVVPKHDK